MNFILIVPPARMETRGAVSRSEAAPGDVKFADFLYTVDFPHEHARSRTFRWGEDGIAGVSDSHGLLNIAISFWNEQDAYLKERLFGLSNPEGNHGESIKECHFHLDNTPTVSFLTPPRVSMLG